jgi:hypothetical protein
MIQPQMMLFDETEHAPIVNLRLPLEVVRSMRDFIYRNATPNDGLDGTVYDEINNQIAQQIDA